MNRVASFIEKATANHNAWLQAGITSAGKPYNNDVVAEQSKIAILEADEFVKFQELKSLAMLEGKLNEGEAQLIYSYLGEYPDHFNRQPLPVKITLMKIYAELLSMRIKRTVAAVRIATEQVMATEHADNNIPF